MKTKTLSFLILGAAMILPSCSKHDKDEITEQTLGTYYNIITDINTGEKTIQKDVSYSVRRNYSNLKVELTVTGLKLPDGLSFPAFTVGPTKWTADGAWLNTGATDAFVTSTSSVRIPTLTNYTFNSWIRYFDNINGSTYTEISYTVNDRYKVNSYPYVNIAWGNTVSVDTKNGQDYSTDQTIYVVEVDPEKNTATLSINNFCMSPESNISVVYIKDIPYTQADDGTLSMELTSGDAVIAGGTDDDAQKMPFTDLKFSLKRGLIRLSYGIETQLGKYNVTCSPQ